MLGSVDVNPGHAAFTFTRVDSSSFAKATVTALSATLGRPAEV
jgi:hypothetical protein